MNNNLFTLTTLTSIALTTLLLTGCGTSSTSSTPGATATTGGGTQGVPANVLTAIDGSMSTLTQDAKNTLAFMGNEERLAYDTYKNLYDYHLINSATEIKALLNISQNAEQYHIQSVQLLVEKYITNLSDFNNTNSDTTQAMGLDMNFTTYTADQLPSGEYNIDSIQELYNVLIAKGEQSK